MIHYTPEVTTMLRSIYAEEGRHYHGLNHIKHLLAKANEWHKTGAIDNSELQLLEHAIWWHDAAYSIYSPHGVNETESWQMFAELLSRGDIKFINLHGWTFADAKMVVSKAIDATARHLLDQDESHVGYPGVKVIQGMLDVDLCGFAESFEVVKYNNELILKEHERKQLPRKTLVENTINFLYKLLERKRIFYTEYFYNKCENVARDNIVRLIAELSDELPREVWTPIKPANTMRILGSDPERSYDPLRVGNGYYTRDGERNPHNPVWFNAKHFVNHAGLTGRVGQGKDGYVLFFDDGTIFYRDNIDSLTILS